MSILERYVAKNLILATLIVMLAILGLDLFFYMINELRYLGKGEYTVGVMLLFLFLKIPTKLYNLFHWSAILGALIGLGNLAKNTELVAMQVSAVSVKRISLFALKGALLLTVFMFCLGEYIAPKTEKLALSKKTMALSSGQAVHTDYGIWVRNANEIVHVATVASNTELFDITIYNFDENLNLLSVSKSKQAEYIDNKWHLLDTIGTKFSDNQTKLIKNKNQSVDKLLDKDIIETTGVKYLERLSLPSLYRTIKIRKENELNASDYEFAFWNKLLKPFVILILVLVAIPFVFGPLRSSSIGLKIVIGAIVGFCFHTLNTVFAPLTVVINMPPFIAAIIPSIIFMVFGLYMTNKIKN